MTNIETDQLTEAMEKMHNMQVKAEEDRKRAESMREESKAQQEIIGDLVERLRVLEERGAGFESRELEGFQSMSEHRARLEFRVQELEAALVAVSTRGEQMAKDTGDAFKTFVDAKNGEVVGQLQKAVTSLSTQLLQLQQEVTQRGMDLQEMAQSEGKARVRDLSLVNETTEDRIAMMQRALEEERVRRDGQATALGQTIDALSKNIEESERIWQEGLKQAMLRVAEDQGKFRGELNELSTKAVTSAEEARNFLEEVVRAEIRGRMQGQQQHAEQILALEEAIKTGHVKEDGELQVGEFNDEIYTQMRLVQAKTKTQGKAIKALSGEIDAAKLIVHTFEKEIADELKSHSSALKSLEDKLTTELALGLQAARDAASGLESRVSGLEAGRTTILDKIYTQVDANRAKDVERARETMERIEGLQRAVDACVEMCQSDLQDVHEGLESVEQRLDREAEGLEALMERTTRQLTNALDSKLQESMGKV